MGTIPGREGKGLLTDFGNIWRVKKEGFLNY